MKVVNILVQYCKGCGLCISVCPKGSLEVSPDLNPMGTYPVRFKEGADCTGCMNCVVMCPDAAIEICEVTEDEPAAVDERK